MAPISPFVLNRMNAGLSIVCASLGFFIAGTEGPRAEDIHRGQACRFELLSTGKVLQVVDGRSVLLDDGREVQISGIYIPSSPASTELPATPAKAVLETMLLDQLVELRGPQDVTDRYGRTVAFVVRRNDPIDVAAELLARGHAWV